MMNKMVVANLAHRPTRSFIAASAVALEVTMILLVVALFYGTLNGSKENQTDIGWDLMVYPPSSSMFLGTSGSPISIKVGNVLQRVSDVNVVAPVIWSINQKPFELIYGIDLNSYEKLIPSFRFLSGGPFQGPNDVIVDDYFAHMDHKGVGDTIEVLNKPFRICGVVPHGVGGRKFVPLPTMQDLTGAEGRVSAFYLKLANPADIAQVTDAIKNTAGMQQYSVVSMQEYLTMMTPENLPAFNLSIRIVIGIAVVVGFLVIFQSMYTAIMERTREIGILKSLGASKLYIVNVILRETTLLAIVGIAAGIVISFIVRHAILVQRPSMHLFWSYQWVLAAAVIALLGSLGGALYPAVKAARRDPIDALAYE
jgi:putative ABC transport system permease protein